MLPGQSLVFWTVMMWALSYGPALAKTIQVTIGGLTYSPAEIQARVGDTIEWVNKDILAHTATARDRWDVTIEPQSSGRVLLNKTGQFEYYCRFHPNMRARMTIERK